MNVGTEILAIIGTVNAVIYGYLITEIRGARSDIKRMVTDQICQERKSSCAKAWCHEITLCREDLKELWDVLNGHSHEGLSGAKIVRERKG